MGGEIYDWVVASGNYVINSSFSMSGSQKMLIMGNAVVHFRGDLRMSDNAMIRFHSADASLRTYLGGNGQLGGLGVQGVVNADQFILYGLPSCNSIVVPFGNFTGLIYASSADVILGVSEVSAGFYGACIARSVTLAGDLAVHFDENLKRVGGIY